ncbi:Twinkle-like protein, chloroplastic/mitochondrial, partial [Quillaja saponaria]
HIFARNINTLQTQKYIKILVCLNIEIKFKAQRSKMRIIPSQFLCGLLISVNNNNLLFFAEHSLKTCASIPRKLGPVWSPSVAHTSKLSSSPGESTIDTPKVDILKHKMEFVGISCDDSCTPGKYHCLLCPKCKGGQSMEKSLSLHIIPDGEFAMWRCFQTQCGWSGQAFADNRELYNRVCGKIKSSGQMTEEGLGLEPLRAQLIAYFNERLISEETLLRNAVMQISGNKSIIAFTYRRNGLLVGCKYRTMEKRFWQEKGTDKMLYGVDDINDASEVIIVEGEIDKLSLEEAGFRNCVSVPGGAPGKVSIKELPSKEKDTAYQYLWNCKDYLDKVGCIILATDSDPPGQALAEELARRLGKERCWQVCWPKKDESSYFKDANEVLKCMGPGALKKIVENAELYTKQMGNTRM